MVNCAFLQLSESSERVYVYPEDTLHVLREIVERGIKISCARSVFPFPQSKKAGYVLSAPYDDIYEIFLDYQRPRVNL